MSSLNREHGNPFLTEDRLRDVEGEGRMTIGGTITKYFLLLTVLLASSGWVFVETNKRLTAAGIDPGKIERVKTNPADEESPSVPMIIEKDANGSVVSRRPVGEVDLGPVPQLMWIGILGGFVCALFCIFKPETTPFFGSIYAVAEGFALGGISALLELQYGGIVMQAFAITVVLQLVVLGLYSVGFLRATESFARWLLAAMMAILLLYIADIVMQTASGTRIGVLHDGSFWGIVISVDIVIVAALNFVIDFDAIEQGVRHRAPKNAEWYAAFGMLLTLVWLYLEVIRLLIKLRSRDRIAKFTRLLRGGQQTAIQSA